MTARPACLVILLAASLAAGCGAGGGAAGAAGGASSSADEELRRHEADFRPSDYDQKPDEIIGEAKPQAGGTEQGNPDGGVPGLREPEVVQGYRVQIVSSPRMEEVRLKKGELELAFPDDWFYLTYDPPAYKLRGGNFPSRLEADRFMKLLAERGYRDTWIVPDRVFKDLPPRSAQPPPPPR